MSGQTGEPSTDAAEDPTGAAARPAAGSGAEMRAAMQESSLIEAMGGVRGVVESSVAGVVFALAYSVSGQNLEVALWTAIASAVVVLVASLVQRRPVRQALGGFVGIAVMAAITRFTGRPQDFFLWPILKNGGFALLFGASVPVRWPLIGVILGPLLGEGMSWRHDRARLRAYQLASLLWAGMFALRFLVQLPLYLAGNVTWLGIQAIPLGLPLFLLVCWAIFVVLARVPLARPGSVYAEDDEGTEDAADEVSGRAG